MGRWCRLKKNKTNTNKNHTCEYHAAMSTTSDDDHFNKGSIDFSKDSITTPIHGVDKRKSFSISYFEDEDDEATKQNNSVTTDDDQDIQSQILKLQEKMKANIIHNKPEPEPKGSVENIVPQQDDITDAEKEKEEDEEEKEKEKIPERKLDKKVKEDLKGLFTPDSFFVLKDMALDGNLDLTGLRGITWRVLLGVLSADTSMWADQIQKHREKFTKLREKHIIDPHKTAGGTELDKFNPLSQHEENPWNQYFQDAELQKEITHDNTYQGNPFFDKPSTKEILTQLLFLYAKEHSTIRYIQGMNELLAPILYVLHHESTPLSDSPTIFDIVSSESEVAADAYTLFSHLLMIVGRWFSPLKSPNSPPTTLSKKDALLDDKLYFGTGQADESTNLQIVQQCRHIHYDLLTEVEPHLSRYLRDLQIEPHLYMLRWVRIVLTQVFTLPDVFIIWDGIFAFGNNAVLLDWLCVAMLVTIRHNLLGQDYSCCMQLLFNYPQNQDVRVLVGTARQLYIKYQHQRQISPPKSATSSPAAKQPTTNTVTQKPASAATKTQQTQAQAQTQARAQSPNAQTQQTHARNASHATMRERAPTPPNAPQFPQAFPEPGRPATPGSAGSAGSTGSTGVAAGHKQKSILQYIFPETPETNNISAEEAQHLRNVSAHMANRLERVLFLLSSLPSTPENEETIKLVSEEVSQVKGTLMEASEFKLKSANLETFDQRQQKANPTANTNYSNNISLNVTNNTTHNNNNNNNNNTSNGTAHNSTNNQTTAPSSPLDQAGNVYEKILAMDPLNIFRRK